MKQKVKQKWDQRDSILNLFKLKIYLADVSVYLLVSVNKQLETTELNVVICWVVFLLSLINLKIDDNWIPQWSCVAFRL